MPHTSNRHSGQAREHLKESAVHLAEGVQEMGSAAKQLASDTVGSIRDRASDYVDQGRTKARELSESLEDQVRAKPMKALLISAAFGFVVGMIFMRR